VHAHCGFVWMGARDVCSRLPFTPPIHTPLVHTFHSHLLFCSRAYATAGAIGSEALQYIRTVALFGWERGTPVHTSHSHLPFTPPIHAFHSHMLICSQNTAVHADCGLMALFGLERGTMIHASHSHLLFTPSVHTCCFPVGRILPREPSVLKHFSP